MPRITITTNGHVSTSPRVWREAGALAAAGFEVTVVGAWTSEESALLDQTMAAEGRWKLICAADLRTNGKQPVLRFTSRLKRRLARELWRVGRGSMEAMVYAPQRLLSASLATRPDLYILHLETGLWMSSALVRRGFRIAFDIEDWYSENLDADQTASKAYMQKLERTALPRARYCTVPSHAMGEALARRYDIAQPLPIYNGDPRRLLMDHGPSPSGPIKLLWFSQTLGTDRGLDDAFAALARIGTSFDWEFDLLCRSSPSARADALRLLPHALHPRVRFLDLVAPSELPALCARYDVGLALEQKVNRNRELTVTNKVLRYPQSGAFLAATATDGQREVVERSPTLGRVYPPRQVEGLAAIIRDCALRLPELRATRTARADAANAIYAYEAQVPALIDVVRRALQVS